MKRPVRIGCVPYLNAQPLIYGLEDSEGVELRFATPRILSGLLEDGEVDLAMLSSITLFQNPGYSFVSDAVIASRGAVRSILLISKRPLSEVERVGLDWNSLTSAGLLRIVLSAKYGLSPVFGPYNPEKSGAEDAYDAVMVIGDNALKASPQNATMYDLGEEWYGLTGLPFVFACWIARSREGLGDVSRILVTAREKGLENLDEIAVRGAEDTGIPEAIVRSYFKENVHFTLGEEELSGLNRFGRYLFEMGQVHALREISPEGS
jgi:chorismate dehydratase